MKKLILLAAIACVGTTSSAQSTWSFGISGSSLCNYSQYSGGMTDAHANFHHNEFGSGAFNFLARKTFSEHWSGQTGIGFSSIGFNFALSQNHSLLNPGSQYVGIGASTSVAYIPVSIIYNTKLNCRNWRWFVGGGLSMVMAGETNYTATTANEEDNSGMLLEQNYSSPSSTTFNGHLLGGIEKVYKRGAILSFGLVLNGGFSNVATTEVNYTIDGDLYNHTFTNNGNYFGGYIAYYFRPFGSKKAASK